MYLAALTTQWAVFDSFDFFLKDLFFYKPYISKFKKKFGKVLFQLR